jgi:hypothetical protein
MRASSRARVSFLLVTVLGAFAAATASAQDVLYLRAGGLLSSEPPAPGAVTAVSSLRIPNGEDALLGSFTTAPVAGDVVLGQTRGVVYLGTGRPGMDGCARVTMSLSRFTGTALFVVASGTVETTIRARRHVVDPIVVPMLLADALVAAAGDRLVFDVRVANDCGGERTVALLYDSVARASALELYAPGATTSTTTTTVVETTTTTTTLPPTCLETATGLAAVRCRLEVMDGILRTSSPASLGGPRFLRRLSRRVERALFFVRAAELVDPTPRRIRKGRRHLGRFLTQLARGLGDGRVAREVGEPLASLAAAATSGLDASLPVR